MAIRFLPGTALRVRRGRRGDLPRMQDLLGVGAMDGPPRFYRRALADLGADVYVAEEAGGAIVGVVSLVYARSFTRGGLSAVLDGAHAGGEPTQLVLEGLVAFAEERARRRGCRRLTACLDAADAELRATLLARGYRAGEVLVAELGCAGGAP
jgi:hypothetical protein